MHHPLTPSELERLTREYSRRLGAVHTPKLVIGPHWRCAYSMQTHTITLGREMVAKASPETCRAILAHEVGHSVEPELRLWYWALHLLPVLCVLSLAILVWDGLSRASVACACIGSPILLVWGLRRYLATLDDKRRLRLELAADRRASKLVGPTACLQSLAEYSRLFNDGQLGGIGRQRLEHLQQALAARAAPAT